MDDNQIWHGYDNDYLVAVLEGTSLAAWGTSITDNLDLRGMDTLLGLED